MRHNGGFVVLDRSYYGDVCFANVQLQMGYFTARDYETYLSHHADMKVNLEPPAMAIFLDVEASVCKDRISKRMSEKEGRKCESVISLDYLNALQREIGSLADSMAQSADVKRMPWCTERTQDEIARKCECFALDIKSNRIMVTEWVKRFVQNPEWRKLKEFYNEVAIQPIHDFEWRIFRNSLPKCMGMRKNDKSPGMMAGLC